MIRGIFLARWMFTQIELLQRKQRLDTGGDKAVYVSCFSRLLSIFFSFFWCRVWASLSTNLTALLSLFVCVCVFRPNTILRLRFNHFATECSWDHLYVYDGDSIYAPLLAAFRYDLGSLGLKSASCWAKQILLTVTDIILSKRMQIWHRVTFSAHAQHFNKQRLRVRPHPCV